MAKPLIIEKDGQSTSFDVSLLERRKLYGSRKRVALNPKGRFCTRASQKKIFRKKYFRRKNIKKKIFFWPSTSSKTRAIVSKLIPQVRDEI